MDWLNRLRVRKRVKPIEQPPARERRPSIQALNLALSGLHLTRPPRKSPTRQRRVQSPAKVRTPARSRVRRKPRASVALDAPTHAVPKTPVSIAAGRPSTRPRRRVVVHERIVHVRQQATTPQAQTSPLYIADISPSVGKLVSALDDDDWTAVESPVQARRSRRLQGREPATPEQPDAFWEDVPPTIPALTIRKKKPRSSRVARRTPVRQRLSFGLTEIRKELELMGVDPDGEWIEEDDGSPAMSEGPSTPMLGSVMSPDRFFTPLAKSSWDDQLSPLASRRM